MLYYFHCNEKLEHWECRKVSVLARALLSFCTTTFLGICHLCSVSRPYLLICVLLYVQKNTKLYLLCNKNVSNEKRLKIKYTYVKTKINDFRWQALLMLGCFNLRHIWLTIKSTISLPFWMFNIWKVSVSVLFSHQEYQTESALQCLNPSFVIGRFKSKWYWFSLFWLSTWCEPPDFNKRVVVYKRLCTQSQKSTALLLNSIKWCPYAIIQRYLWYGDGVSYILFHWEIATKDSIGLKCIFSNVWLISCNC